MKTATNTLGNTRAFSLPELLAVVAAMAIILTVAVTAAFNSRGELKKSKLEQDVSRINDAIQIYRSSGGSLEGIETAQDAITELKKAASATGQRQVVGLRGSMIDKRLQAVSDEDGAFQDRAIWKEADQKFVIEQARTGVIEFVLNEELGAVNYADAERRTKLLYNPGNGWVWDSGEAGYGGYTGPSELPVVSAPTLGASVGTGSANMSKLGAPIISPDTGYHPLAMFPLEVTITKQPTDPADAKIFYSTEPGVWGVYGGPFVVEPGTTVVAYSSNLDPAWEDSPEASALYETDPEALEIDVYTPKSPITYMEAGGPLEPGNYTPPTVVDPIVVTLPGGWEIPDVYEDSQQFQFYWTLDGSDPRTSNTRIKGISFSNGYKNNNGHGNNYSGIDISNPQWEEQLLRDGWTQAEIDEFKQQVGDDEMKPHDRIEYTINEWDGASLLPVRVVAQSKNNKMFTNSFVLSSNITIDKTKLRRPKIVYSDDAVRGDLVEISLEVDYGDMPVGARIYYTTDGTEPGVDEYGNPTNGTLYTGPFDPLLGSDQYDGEVMILARVYPPEDYPEWFESSYSSSSLFLVEAWNISGVATGWFQDENGQLSRFRSDSESGSYFEWSGAGGETEVTFDSVSNREVFEIGQFTYTNGTGYVAGEMEAFDFTVQLDLGSEVSQFNYAINQYITYNTGTDLENADVIALDQTLAQESINLFGTDYGLNLVFGEATEGGMTLQNQFRVLEGQTSSATLYGNLVSLDSWW